MRSADISREIYPAVNLNFAVFPSLSARSFINCLHQRKRCELTWITNDRTCPPICQSLEGKGGESNGAGGMRRGFGGVGIGWRVCGRAQLLQKRFVQTLRKMVRVTSFLHAQLSLVLPCSGLWLAHVWPWLFPSHGTAKWNLLWPFLFQPIFSRVYPVLSRVRPARLLR